MEPVIAFAPYTGWVYPNETVFEWSVLIAVYPYLTGLVAGAFTVSSLYQVFGFERLRPVAHLALLTSLSFMIFVPTPLLLHLGHPERAFNSTITPHLTSAMAMFGFFASFYVALLILEGWFAYRPFIVEQAQKRTDLLGKVYRLMTLGSYDVSEHAMRYDRKWIFALAVIGIPDERMGEVAKAFIVRRPGSTLDEAQVIAWSREHMANYKVPRTVIFLDELPMNAGGKVDKTALLKMSAQALP